MSLMKSLRDLRIPWMTLMKSFRNLGKTSMRVIKTVRKLRQESLTGWPAVAVGCGRALGGLAAGAEEAEERL